MNATDSTISPVTTAGNAEDAAAAMKLWTSFAAQAEYQPGRREFFRYRDLGVERATNGGMRATQNTSIAGMEDSTGWHYHICEMQFVYLLRGEMVIEFEDGNAAHFTAGDAFFVPGGTRHNEVYISADKDSVEVIVPAKIGTVPCERPAHLPPVLKVTGSEALARRLQAERQAG